MELRVNKIGYTLNDNNLNPSNVIITFFDRDPYSKLKNFKIEYSPGHMYPKNKRVRGGEGDLKILKEDFVLLENVIAHWSNIRSGFIHRDTDSFYTVGHHTSTYTFPNGEVKKYQMKKRGKPFDLEIVKGRSIDDKFPNGECKYIANHPYKQVYEQNGLKFSLYQDDLTVSRGKAIQYFEGCQIIALGKFFSYITKNDNAFEELIGLKDR